MRVKTETMGTLQGNEFNPMLERVLALGALNCLASCTIAANRSPTPPPSSTPIVLY